MSKQARSWGRAVGTALLTAVIGSTVVVASAQVADAIGFDCSASGPAYTVRAGDGWFSVAERLSVSASALLDANEAEADDVIVPGDRLCLPSGADLSAVCGSRYSVVAGDSWFGIAAAARIEVSPLLGANGAKIDDVLFAGQTLCLPDGASIAASSPPASGSSGSPTTGQQYTIKAGDSWSAIADRAEVTLSALLAANGASSSTVLLPGRTIVLPAGATIDDRARYVVQAGDSWSVIADRAEVSMSSLLAENDATASTLLVPGRTIVLPAGASISSAGSSDSGSSDSGSSDSGSSDSGSPSVRPGPSYVIRSGDSWSSIADRAAVSLSSLLTVNGASASTVLLPGRSIVLPAGARTLPPPVLLAAKPTQGPCWFGDTWLDPRDGGRGHLGVDVFTLTGSYVYAVVDGRLTGRRWADAGSNAGNAWVLTGDDGNRYFYAHLADFDPELSTGSRVEAGQILGWVGGTGNASAPHLHFEIRPGGGEPVNPFPIVQAQGACNRGTPYTQPGGWVPDPIG